MATLLCLCVCDELEKLRYTIQVAVRCVVLFFLFSLLGVTRSRFVFVICLVMAMIMLFVVCSVLWLEEKRYFVLFFFIISFLFLASNKTNEWRGYIDARIFLLLFVLYSWVFYFIFIIILVLQCCHSCLFKEWGFVQIHKSVLEDLNTKFSLFLYTTHTQYDRIESDQGFDS